MAQEKSLFSENECKKWSPTVRSTDAAPWNPHLRPCFNAQLTVYITSDKQGWWKTEDLPQRFCLLHYERKNRKTLGILVITSYLFLKNKKLQIKEKHLIVQKNAQSDHQKWYQKPQHLERHIYRIVALSTDCIQQQWRTRLTENWQFTAAVWPPSLWKKNHQTPDIFVLTSYLCLEFIFCFYVTQFNVFFCIESDENKLWQ